MSENINGVTYEQEELKRLLLNQLWRLNNLYKIKDAHGNKIRFKMNWAQMELYRGLHTFNVILKARQLGFTTFAMIYFLDSCLWNDNHSAGVVAHAREAAEDLFRNKIRFAYDELPAWVKDAVPSKSENARVLEFANGSSIAVGTSLRSGTFQKLLVSEYGKTSVREPEKAKEIKTGAFNTVHTGQQILIESTAEGQSGEFYEIVQRARALQGQPLTEMDPKFFFFPWYKDPKYQLNAEVSIDAKMDKYFKSLPEKLTPEQKAWYIKKSAEQGDAMFREFPSTPEESFQGSMEGSIYYGEMIRARTDGRICRVPWEPSRPVHTFWDLGNRDPCAVWFFQHIGMEYRFIDYWEGSDVGGLPTWRRMLQDRPYIYGNHYWPHDGNYRQMGTGKLLKEMAEELGIRPIVIVPRTRDKQTSIEKARPIISRAWFDSERCVAGIKHLEDYRRMWDDNLGQWSKDPRHDQSSHCFIADTKVLTRDGTYSISTLPNEGEVLTLCGWKPYKNPRVTRKNAQIVEVTFDDGSTVKCTPDHLFLTESGWKSAKDLENCSAIQLSLTLQHNTLTEKFIGYTRRVINIFTALVEDCIGTFGKMHLARYQKDATYITKTETDTITNYQTLNAWTPKNICNYLGLKITKINRYTFQKKQEKRQRNGTSQKKGAFGIKDIQTEIKTGTNINTVTSSAKIAALNLTGLLEEGQELKNGARLSAGVKRITSVKKISETQDVWCLTVPDFAHFTLFNNVVVHNCADALMTMADGYQGRTQEFVDFGDRVGYADVNYDILNS